MLQQWVWAFKKGRALKETDEPTGLNLGEDSQKIAGAYVLDGCGEWRENWQAIARLEEQFEVEISFRMPSAELSARTEAVLVEALFSGPPALGAQVASVLNAPALNLCITKNGKPTLGVVRDMVHAIGRGLLAEPKATLEFCRAQFFEIPDSILDGTVSQVLKDLCEVRNGLVHGRTAEWDFLDHRRLCSSVLGTHEVGWWLHAAPRVSVSELFLLRAARRVVGNDPT